MSAAIAHGTTGLPIRLGVALKASTTASNTPTHRAMAMRRPWAAWFSEKPTRYSVVNAAALSHRVEQVVRHRGGEVKAERQRATSALSARHTTAGCVRLL